MNSIGKTGMVETDSTGVKKSPLQHVGVARGYGYEKLLLLNIKFCSDLRMKQGSNSYGNTVSVQRW